MQIDLEKKYIDFIKNAVSQNLKEFKLYIFGSRVKNTARQYSDIDLAISSDELTDKIKSHIEFIFENSTIPYKIDFVDLNKISLEFKNLIKDDLIEI